MARKKTTKTEEEAVEEVTHTHADLEARVAKLEEANELLLETVETMKAVVALKDDLAKAKEALGGDISELQSVAKELLNKVGKKMDSNSDGEVDFDEIYRYIRKRMASRTRR